MTTAAAWYLYNEDGDAGAPHSRKAIRPSLSRSGSGRIVEADSPFPVVGDHISNSGDWTTAEIVAFEELAHVCAMRRFKVIIRILC